MECKVIKTGTNGFMSFKKKGEVVDLRPALAEKAAADGFVELPKKK